ncbi:6156_t:CDS:2 [Dentiscutata erythropus]|uniref:6156_t:CDS:1 n=1 Tax=Dentiscutata erythropus TaxID=1348616 RepID=A0A9N9J7J8_9GLOM|nr:6156_t:CDS:2 [Dentiscutata erythropus]
MSWEECKEQISNNPVARYKKFTDKEEAQLFMKSCELKTIFKNRFLACSTRIIVEVTTISNNSKVGIGINFENIDVVVSERENCSKLVRDLALEGAEKEFVERMEVDVETNSSSWPPARMTLRRPRIKA